MFRIWLGVAVALGLPASVAFAQQSAEAARPAGGDAQAAVKAVEEPKPATVEAGGQTGQTQRQSAAGGGGSGNSRMRRSVAQATADATSSPEVLTVLKSGTPEHVRVVYQLNSVPAATISNTVKQVFRSEAELRRRDGEKAEQTVGQNVVVVPSSIDNSVVISGSPDAVNDVRTLLEKLDRPRGIVSVDMEIGEVPAGEPKASVPSPSPAEKSPQPTTAGQFRLAERPEHMEAIGRIRLTTMDNQPAFVQIGARVPRVTSANVTSTGSTNSVNMENVGLILGLTPRITAGGAIVMEINAEQSQPGPENEGTPILATQDKVVRAPRIEVTTVQTTIEVPDGQTVILGSVARQGRLEKDLVFVITSHIIRP